MYKVSGRVKFGLTLSLVTTLLWGLLPIALKDVLAAMDPYTITFYRFLSSGIVLLLWLSVRGGLPVQRQFNAGVLVIILIAAFGLIVNYGAYLIGLELLEPKAAQVLIQLAPFLLLIGGVVFFKEAFSYQQGLGAIAVFVGLSLFFNQRIEQILAGMGQYTQGVMWVSFAALMWAVYALLQKLLLRHFTSVQLMMFINLLGALIFFGLATPTQLFLLNERQAWLLAFCCLNTVFAYGAFAEALVHWEASKVSAVLALAPLITIATLDGLSWYRPDLYQSVHLNVLAVLGAFLVIGGSATAALTKRAVKLYPTSLETPQYDKRQPEAE